jgi:hypothetical protein
MKITGGYKGYQEAVTEAFSAKMHNPALKYSPDYGFYVESDLTPTDKGDVNLGQVYYSLNNNGKNSEGGRANYIRVKAEIISELKGLDAEMQFMREHEEIFF